LGLSPVETHAITGLNQVGPKMKPQAFPAKNLNIGHKLELN